MSQKSLPKRQLKFKRDPCAEMCLERFRGFFYRQPEENQGVVLSALAHLTDAPRLRDLVAHETGTLGVRVTVVDRWPFARQPDEVEVEGLPVRIKRTALRVKVEYEDAARVARRTGLPLREVVSRAEAEARRRSPDNPQEGPTP